MKQLEENILTDGVVINPLIVWDGVIVDGHNRYRILQKHPEIQFTTYEKQFSDRYAAIAWICKNQLGRRNLTPQQFKYLVGQRYEAEKQSKGIEFQGNQYTSQDRSGLGQNDPDQKSHGTRSRIAKETQTSDSYVRRAAHFAKGVDAADETEPGIKQEILSGSIKSQRRPWRPLPRLRRRSGPLWSSSSGRPKKPRSPKKSRSPGAAPPRPCKPSGISQPTCCSPTEKSTQTISAQNWKTPWTP